MRGFFLKTKSTIVMNRIQRAGQSLDEKVISNAGRYGVALKIWKRDYPTYLQSLQPNGIIISPDPRYTKDTQELFIDLNGNISNHQ